MIGAMLLVFLSQEARYEQKIVEMNDLFWKERLKLAEWAKSNGLPREAKGLLEFMVRHIPGRHPYKSRAENLLVGSWKKKPNSATEARQKEYLRKLESYYRSVADRCFEAYGIAKSAGLAKESETALAKTVEFYTDHAAARKERGEVRIEGFGWVSVADARRPVVALGEKSVEELEQEDDRHATWAEAWVVRSQHYLLRTDLPIRRATAVLDLLEKFYESISVGCEKAFAEPPSPMGVYFFRRTQDLEAERARLPQMPASVSFFHGLTNLVYVRSFDSEREKGDGVGQSDQEFLLHECTHQFLDMATEQRVFSAFQQANMRADAADNYWIVEGVASHFGTLGLPDSWRMPMVKRLLAEKRLPALRSFLEKDYDQFLAQSHENYAIAYALALFLMEDRKKPTLDFLREYYLGNGSVESFEKIVGRADTLEARFRAWVDAR